MNNKIRQIFYSEWDSGKTVEEILESIILKCIEICDNEEIRKAWNDDYKWGRKSSAQDIKKYFEIE